MFTGIALLVKFDFRLQIRILQDEGDVVGAEIVGETAILLMELRHGAPGSHQRLQVAHVAEDCLYVVGTALGCDGHPASECDQE